MADDKDLEEIARTATDDFYELLGVAFDAGEVELKRAYRKASIKAHPDKNPDDPNAADRFIRLGIARDILIDVKLKAEYDRQRQLKRERQLKNDLLDGNRRKMKEDLERREREGFTGFKRKRGGEMTDAEKRQVEEQRIAENNKRVRKEMEEKLRRARQEEEARFAEPAQESEPIVQYPAPGKSAEIDRTVKVRFYREGDTIAWDKEKVTKMFEKYGKIDSVVMGQDKKIKIPGEKHRKIAAIVLIVYTRIDHAYTAVSDARTHNPQLESVSWAGKEPDLKSPPASASAPSTPLATPNKAFRASFGGGGIPLVSGKGLGTPGTPKFAFSPNSPSLQERTMMRLKQAEKKALEEKIRREEAAEESKEAVG
ncbi:DnaJ-domain-containing protein [Byssothecium circinans]|uniref:DnaJ-domain-containing protein n=1 Tax=Byssothecium circinans TaxID=147558 RepID=A0A6A5TZZ5_9PLEO|nr:DnaJ-domain-containing protein [Byssothecium circinans]